MSNFLLQVIKNGEKTLLGTNCNDFLVLGARHQVVARHCTAETQSCPRLTRPHLTSNIRPNLHPLFNAHIKGAFASSEGLVHVIQIL